MAEALTEGRAYSVVGYRPVQDDYDTSWRYCRICQKHSGAPALVFTIHKLDDFVVEQGVEAIGRIRLVQFGERGFYTRCGMSLLLHVDPIDDPETVTPGFHLFYEKHIGWEPAGNSFPHHGEFRPDTHHRAFGETSL